MAQGVKRFLCLAFAQTVFLSPFFTGCTAVPLEQRCLVRGIVFTAAGNMVQASILTVDLEAAEDGSALGSAYAAAATPQEALQLAAQKLEGRVFWGLTDTLILPSGCDYARMEEITACVTDTIAPCTETDVFLACKKSTMPAAEQYALAQEQKRAGGLRCGLERCFAHKTAAVLPQLTETYAASVLRPGQSTVLLEPPATAQLAELLAGDAAKLSLALPDTVGPFMADAALRYELRGGSTLAVVLQLHAADPRASDAQKQQAAVLLQAGWAELRAKGADLNWQDWAGLNFWRAVAGDGTASAPADVAFDIRWLE